MSLHQDGYDQHLDDAYAIMERAAKGSSQFVLPGAVRTEMRDSDAPSSVLHDYITGPLLATVLHQAQDQLDTLISPGGTPPPYLAKHQHIAELIDLARAIQSYAETVTPKQ